MLRIKECKQLAEEMFEGMLKCAIALKPGEQLSPVSISCKW